MIKFFRKIRQQLLTENKFSKYLKYAIGEIVLVVIEILMASQINHCNKKTKANHIILMTIFKFYHRSWQFLKIKYPVNNRHTKTQRLLSTY